MGFLDMLDHQPGFFVQRFPRRVRVTHCPSCKSEFQYTQEKAVDTTMVADMLRPAAVDAFDVAVLISGDADHTPAVEGVRALGKQVYLASLGRLWSLPQLRRVAFDHIDLTEGLLRFGDESEEAEDRSWTSPPEELMIHEPPQGREIL